MIKYLLGGKGQFYKANLHSHTTLSDGLLTPEEVKALYKEHGYSIVAFTDHDILIPHKDLKDDSFLPLNGLDRKRMSVDARLLACLCRKGLYPVVYPLIYPAQVIRRKLCEAAFVLRAKKEMPQ